MADASSSAMKSRRPPTRSVRMPNGRRQIEPLSTAIAVSQENWILLRCSCSLMGTASTPNISQTANSSVNAAVDSTRTRVAPLSRAVGVAAVADGGADCAVARDDSVLMTASMQARLFPVVQVKVNSARTAVARADLSVLARAATWHNPSRDELFGRTILRKLLRRRSGADRRRSGRLPGLRWRGRAAHQQRAGGMARQRDRTRARRRSGSDRAGRALAGVRAAPRAAGADQGAGARGRSGRGRARAAAALHRQRGAGSLPDRRRRDRARQVVVAALTALEALDSWTPRDFTCRRPLGDAPETCAFL